MAIGFYKQTFREGDGGDPMGGGGEALEEFTRLRAYAISVGAISLALCTLVIFYRNIRPGDARAFLEEVTRLPPCHHHHHHRLLHPSITHLPLLPLQAVIVLDQQKFGMLASTWDVEALLATFLSLWWAVGFGTRLGPRAPHTHSPTLLTSRSSLYRWAPAC